VKLTDFPERNVVFAKDQPEYLQLPAYKLPSDGVGGDGRVICCWVLTWGERLKLLFTGRLWHHVLTFHDPLQPQFLEVDKPECLRNAPVWAKEKISAS
jgi:hypothetical protein